MRSFSTACLALSLFLFFAAIETRSQSAERPQVPEIRMQALDGDVWSLSDHHGKVIVLNFWATWCEPCRTEKPMLNRMAEELADEGLLIAGISLDDGNTELVQKFVDEYKIGYTILMAAPDSPWAQIDNLPTTILIDKNGRMAEKYVGAVPEDELRKDLEALLNE